MTLTLAPAQCRMARAALRWTVQELAAKAGVGRATTTRFEVEQAEPMPATPAVIRRAFEAAGVEFASGDVPGVRPSPA